MNFDIKDVKSWATRHDVRTLSVTGFFGDSLSEIDDEIKRYNNGEKDRLHKLYMIRDDSCFCFSYVLHLADTCAFEGTNNFTFFLPTNFAFFLPLNAVKEDKPLNAVKEDKPKEKRYRPFKTIDELEKALNKVNRSAHQFMCVGNDIFIRDKNQMTHLMITRIDRDAKTNEVINVNGMSPIYLFNNYEIRVGAEWLPFGVEIEND